jgi:hypothetical protein
MVRITLTDHTDEGSGDTSTTSSPDTRGRRTLERAPQTPCGVSNRIMAASQTTR